MIADPPPAKPAKMSKAGKSEAVDAPVVSRESKPGLRKFCGVQDIPNVLSGLGTAVLSTSGGVVSGKEARKRKLGGELICTIW